MIARFGTPARPGQSYRRRPGAYAILHRDGQILLTHQSHPEPEYQLPGGGIDAGESAIAALHREVFEETGYGIGAPQYLGSYRRFCFMPEYDFFAEKMCQIWLARPILCRGAPPEAHHRAVWTTPRQALADLADLGARAFLRGSGLV